MPRVGCKAQPVRHGVCQRGATTRQGERAAGPIGPATLAQNSGPGTLRDLERVVHGAMRALAAAGVLGANVTGVVDGTELDTTDRDPGCGEGTRTVHREETRGKVHDIAVPVYGWKVLRVSAAVTKRPWAVTVGPMQAPAARWARALVTPARMHLAGDGRRATVVCAQGFVEGSTRWWLAQHDRRVVGPATTTLAVPAEARAQAAAGEDRTVGRRVPTVRHGPGQGAWSARLETEGVGITGLTTDDHEGPPEQACHANRRDFQANPLTAVVVRPWPGKD
jgi:hypothetical protein